MFTPQKEKKKIEKDYWPLGDFPLINMALLDKRFGHPWPKV